MQPIKFFLTEEQIETLATRSNFRYGKSMAEDGVTIIKTNAFNIEAKSKTWRRRRTHGIIVFHHQRFSVEVHLYFPQRFIL